ncbi:FecR family protein [Pedobacter sp.]
MPKQDITNLLKRYNAGECTDEERDLIESWYLQYQPFEGRDLSAKEREKDLENIWAVLPINRRPAMRLKLIYRIAAAIAFICLSVGIYYSVHRPEDQLEVIEMLGNRLQPGSDKAVLTLSNGKQIVLTGATNGKLADEQQSAVVKTTDGTVSYAARTAAIKAMPVYNMLSTPAGGTYRIILSDGTIAWLDAASSIRYPVVFQGDERRVEITGQVYFEVSHMASKPFRVNSKNQVVEVLGTHFNINSYEDENTVTTTLLQGSVKVSKGANAALLKPGQEAATENGSKTIKVNPGDTETAVAWQKGLFRFKRADLPTVMRQFARWYDVEVVYEEGIPPVAITGKLERRANASQVLKIINGLGIKFKTEGRKIIIIKQ